MEDDLITTKEVGDYRIKVYYCHDSECPITNWGLFGSFFFEYSDMHRLHDECNWKTFFYDNKHDLRDVIDAIVMKHIKQKDIVKYLKKGEANGISFTYNRGSYDNEVCNKEGDWKEDCAKIIDNEVKSIGMWMWGDVKGYVLEKKVAFTKKYKDESREDEDCEEREEVDSCRGCYEETDELIKEVMIENGLEE